jgi:hypothetical protein
LRWFRIIFAILCVLLFLSAGMMWLSVSDGSTFLVRRTTEGSLTTVVFSGTGVRLVHVDVDVGDSRWFWVTLPPRGGLPDKPFWMYQVSFGPTKRSEFAGVVFVRGTGTLVESNSSSIHHPPLKPPANPSSLWTLEFPWFYALLLTGVPPIVIFTLEWRHTRLVQIRLATGLCLHCGYDLRASPGRCPECGAAVGYEPTSLKQ